MFFIIFLGGYFRSLKVYADSQTVGRIISMLTAPLIDIACGMNAPVKKSNRSMSTVVPVLRPSGPVAASS